MALLLVFLFKFLVFCFAIGIFVSVIGAIFAFIGSIFAVIVKIFSSLPFGTTTVAKKSYELYKESKDKLSIQNKHAKILLEN